MVWRSKRLVCWCSGGCHCHWGPSQQLCGRNRRQGPLQPSWLQYLWPCSGYQEQHCQHCSGKENMLMRLSRSSPFYQLYQLPCQFFGVINIPHPWIPSIVGLELSHLSEYSVFIALCRTGNSHWKQLNFNAAGTVHRVEGHSTGGRNGEQGISRRRNAVVVLWGRSLLNQKKRTLYGGQ